jgi:DNA repair exonuclease SbcCD ATPase subunit
MDVEAILNEIRNRVADTRANPPAAGTEGPANGSAPQSNQSESLSRVSAHLAVTGRSWDRLPPVFSNRHGTLARIELWFKKKSKPLTRWFTWEQVNFNRAVNDALGDVVEILKAEAHELAAMRAQLTQEMRREFSTLRTGADEHARLLQDIEARGNQADAALKRISQIITSVTDENHRRQAELAEQYLQVEHQLASLQSEHSRLQSEHSTLEAEHSKLANQVIELAAQLREEDREIKSQQDQEITRRLSDLAAELKDEQRVCLRQVSLEASESSVLEDRARRALLQRLEKLEATLKTAPRG